MAALRIDGAAAPGRSMPTNDEGPTVATVAPQGIEQDENPDCRGVPPSGQALRFIEGERRAGDYLARLHAQQADPDELAFIVGMLYGAALRGFCRVIGKALGVQHG